MTLTPVTGALRVVVGAGAQGRVTLENWRSAAPLGRFVYLDDDRALHGTKLLDVEVTGGLADLRGLVEAPGGAQVILAIGNPVTRRVLAAKLEEACGPLTWGIAVHASSVVMPSARVGGGTVIFAGAVVNTAAAVGRHVIINTGVVVEHDCVIEDGSNLSPGVCMGGRVHVGAGAFVSTGATLAPRVRVGAGAIVGAGAVVVRDVPDRTMVMGVPAKHVRDLDPSFDWRRLL